MPVIINDLEVILENAETSPTAADGAPPPPVEPEAIGTLLSPITLARIERLRRERAARLRAY